MSSNASNANALIHEKSPYLQQHAHNPVQWCPWGEEALARARREDRPILLSIGYSTCHWCHVMERESFTDPRTAAIMNDHFVCIKVDREERPDLDRVYIAAVTALSGSAGWPLNVFLTPSLEPFFGGTYFPPEARSGIIAWPDLLQLIAQAWANPEQRPKIVHSARQLTTAVAGHLGGAGQAGSLNAQAVQNAVAQLKRQFDPEHGGFSPAPKFPQPSILYLLLTLAGLRQVDETAARMTQQTLMAMARGGIYDQLGGGFHRYSTDARWHVPHFEKMLYDNAQLLTIYAEAYRLFDEPLYAAVVTQTANYLIAELTHPEGGFYSAEDADSLPLDSEGGEKREGAFYVWRWPEVQQLLDETSVRLLAKHYDLQPNGNVRYDPHGEFGGANILHVRGSLDAEREALLDQARARLLEARRQRPRPHRDEKILTSWNGLAISGLARAYQMLGEPAWLTAAQRAAGFVRQRLYESDPRQLFRRWCDGERQVPGMADDYAFLLLGLTDLYAADFDPAWLLWAAELAEAFIERFQHPESGAIFLTAADHDTHLIVRPREDSDNALPSAAALGAAGLLRLGRLLDRGQWIKAAEQALGATLGAQGAHPAATPACAAVLAQLLAPPVEVIIAAEPGGVPADELLQTARRTAPPQASLMAIADEHTREILARHLPFIRSATAVNGLPAAYLCINRNCQAPLTDAASLASRLRAV